MAEVKEKINEIMDDLRGRIRNPLILSFILVWFCFHWDLIYSILTIDLSIPLASRLEIMKDYMRSEAGWRGMIFKPLGWSFVSLVSYYLIAIAAQGIKVLVAKRLNAALLAKIDTGSFALKSELKAEKNYSKKLNQELEREKTTLASYQTEKEKTDMQVTHLRTQLHNAERERDEFKNNVLSNKQFIESFEQSLLFLLAKAKGLDLIHFNRQELLKSHYKIISGNWDVFSSQIYTKNSGTSNYFVFDNDKALDRSGSTFGNIIDLSYDKGYGLVSFTINKGNVNEKFHLIRLHEDEMIGFWDNQFVHFKRKA